MQVRLWAQWATGGFTDLSDAGGSFLRTYDIQQAAAPEECRFPASRMAGVLRAARDLNEHPHSRPRRTALLNLWRSWTEAENAAHLMRALERDMRDCAAFRDRVRASYRVATVPTPRGQDVGIDITIDNDLDDQIVVTMSGRMRAHDLLPTVTSQRPRNRLLVWGGLVGDQAKLNSRSIRTFRQNLNAYRKHLSLAETGRLSEIRPRVDAYVDSRGIGCNLPVPAQ